MSLPRGSHSNCGSQPSGWEPFFFVRKSYPYPQPLFASFCQHLENVRAAKNGKLWQSIRSPMLCDRHGVQACNTAAAIRALADENPVFHYLLAWASAMQKPKSPSEGIYSAQNVFYEVSGGEDRHLPLWGPQQPAKGHNKRTPADAGVLEYRYLVEGFPSGRSLANCRKFTAIT